MKKSFYIWMFGLRLFPILIFISKIEELYNRNEFQSNVFLYRSPNRKQNIKECYFSLYNKGKIVIFIL